MQTVFLSLVHFQPQQPVGSKITSSWCGNPAAGSEQGFEDILKNILGAEQEPVPTVQSQTPYSSSPQPVSQPKPSQEENKVTIQDLTLLEAILQKLASALQESTSPLQSPDELNQFFQNVLTKQEIAFLSKFAQLNNFQTKIAFEKNPDMNVQPDTGAHLTALLQKLLNTIAKPTLESQQPSPTLQAEGTVISPKDIFINQNNLPMGLPQNQQTQQLNTSQNILELLTMLRTVVQKLSEAPLNNQPSAFPTNQQVLLSPSSSDNVLFSSQETAAFMPQTPLKSLTDTAMNLSQPSVQPDMLMGETTKSLTGIFSQFSSSSEHGDENLLNQQSDNLAKILASFTESSGAEDKTLARALLLQKSQVFAQYLRSFSQGADSTGQSLPPTITESSLLQKLTSMPQPDVFTHINTTQGKDTQPVGSVPTGSNLFETTNVFKHLVQTGEQHPLQSRLDTTAQPDTVFTKPPVNSAYVIQQLLDKLNAAARHGGQRISMQLFPPDLGKLHVELALKHNELRATVIAESSQVKQMLEANIEQLRTGLEAHNIHLDKLSVMVAGENAQSFERFASQLRDQAYKDRKQSTLANTVNELTPTQAGDELLPMHQNIIRADMVDVFV